MIKITGIILALGIILLLISFNKNQDIVAHKKHAEIVSMLVEASAVE